MDRKRQQENEQAAVILKALAHPVRLCMVRGLMERGRNNVSYMESCLDVSQSGISQHLSSSRQPGSCGEPVREMKFTTSSVMNRLKKL